MRQISRYRWIKGLSRVRISIQGNISGVKNCKQFLLSLPEVFAFRIDIQVRKCHLNPLLFIISKELFLSTYFYREGSFFLLKKKINFFY